MSTTDIIVVDGRTFRLWPTSGGWHSNGFDIIETTGDREKLLTLADPWVERPTEDQLRAFLAPRKQALVALMAKYDIRANDDYQYEEEYELLEGVDPAGRYVAVYRDETYHHLDVVETAEEALSSLACVVSDNDGSAPVGVYDLDARKMLEIGVDATVKLAGGPGDSDEG